MADQKFEVGAVVMLKSGGPKMTVMSYNSDTEEYLCRWFYDNKSSERYFKKGTLEAKEEEE